MRFNKNYIKTLEKEDTNRENYKERESKLRKNNIFI
jgi:hypothetical protein